MQWTNTHHNKNYMKSKWYPYFIVSYRVHDLPFLLLLLSLYWKYSWNKVNVGPCWKYINLPFHTVGNKAKIYGCLPIGIFEKDFFFVSLLKIVYYIPSNHQLNQMRKHFTLHQNFNPLLTANFLQYWNKIYKIVFIIHHRVFSHIYPNHHHLCLLQMYKPHHKNILLRKCK